MRFQALRPGFRLSFFPSKPLPPLPYTTRRNSTFSLWWEKHTRDVACGSPRCVNRTSTESFGFEDCLAVCVNQKTVRMVENIEGEKGIFRDKFRDGLEKNRPLPEATRYRGLRDKSLPLTVPTFGSLLPTESSLSRDFIAPLYRPRTLSKMYTHSFWSPRRESSTFE